MMYVMHMGNLSRIGMSQAHRDSLPVLRLAIQQISGVPSLRINLHHIQLPQVLRIAQDRALDELALNCATQLHSTCCLDRKLDCGVQVRTWRVIASGKITGLNAGKHGRHTHCAALDAMNMLQAAAVEFG